MVFSSQKERLPTLLAHGSKSENCASNKPPNEGMNAKAGRLSKEKKPVKARCPPSVRNRQLPSILLHARTPQLQQMTMCLVLCSVLVRSKRDVYCQPPPRMSQVSSHQNELENNLTLSYVNVWECVGAEMQGYETP